MWSRAHIAEFILIFFGLICVGWFVFTHADAALYQYSESNRLDSRIRVGVSSPKIPALERGDAIGRIEIPRIKVSAVVLKGTDDATLKRAAGHVSSTALPGQPGNVGIAAHRDTFFRNLQYVREGDVIRLTTTWGVYDYTVDSLKIVMPKNIEVLDPTAMPSLTLVTCYPFNYVGRAPKRFIVRATQDDQLTRNSGKSVKPPQAKKVWPVT